MSGIAGIVHFDGAPVSPGMIEKMTAAMAHRGPDGIQHWRQGSVALGQCMLRTTPESLEETQPLANEDNSLVLVIDGRVDNWEELRKGLLGRGTLLRDCSDAELVLRAFEIWGKRCLDRIIGEFVFFIWDGRHQRFFGARDAVGTRHFFYHSASNRFLFSSEIKGLLASGLVKPRLNESRLFDYLVPEFDRDDEVNTFYRDVVRLPAGHAIEVTTEGVRTWRYWDPTTLPETSFVSIEECAEAYLERLRASVRCRLRTNGSVGAMLSGGLDSSSIVGLINKEFSGGLLQPLNTFSLIRDDRDNCNDWKSIREMLEVGVGTSNIIPSSIAKKVANNHLESIRASDEPFAYSHGLTYSLVYAAAGNSGCRVVLDGMAGDLMFFGLNHSIDILLRSGTYRRLPEAFAALGWHGARNRVQRLVKRGAVEFLPDSLKYAYRSYKQRRNMLGDAAMMHHHQRISWLSEKVARRHVANRSTGSLAGHAEHAQRFMGGLLSFGHEVYGQIAFQNGLEPRSPFSDRRMVEFAIQLPTEAKLAIPCYKHLARVAMLDILPEQVRWRRDIASHPGWRANEQLIDEIAEKRQDIWSKLYIADKLRQWIDPKWLSRTWDAHQKNPTYETRYQLFVLVALARWVDSHPMIE